MLYIFYNIWGHYYRFISSYPLINGFCQDSWHIGVDRDWIECKERQLGVEIGQMRARNDRDFRKSGISPASCKQIHSSPKIKMLENCYVCFYKFINCIISYLLLFHNEHIII